MTKKQARAKLKAMEKMVENGLHVWIRKGEDLEVLMDKRDRFLKKNRKLLGLAKE
jgi:hypothetical protein